MYTHTWIKIQSLLDLIHLLANACSSNEPLQGMDNEILISFCKLKFKGTFNFYNISVGLLGLIIINYYYLIIWCGCLRHWNWLCVVAYFRQNSMIMGLNLYNQYVMIIMYDLKDTIELKAFTSKRIKSSPSVCFYLYTNFKLNFINFKYVCMYIYLGRHPSHEAS